MRSPPKDALVLLALLACTSTAWAQVSTGTTIAAATPVADFEDYRTSAGTMVDGTLFVRLHVHAAAWKPWGATGPALTTHVYSTDGSAPRTPGPLIRARVGTPVQLTIRNSLGDELIMRGLRDRGAIPANAPPFTPIVTDSIAVPPGGERQVQFTPTVAGTFVYFGKTIGAGESATVPGPFPVRSADRSLWGVLIVDPAGDELPRAPAEQIFLITHWADPALPGTFLPATRFFVNGASWPHTARLEYTQGDTVRWRVINATGRPHPMHLHGAYFTVEARGTQLRETVFPRAEQRLGVTETLDVTETMRISWVAHEPGNWLFHCHFMRHMSWLQGSLPDADPRRHAAHGTQGEDLLGGLVVGIHVRPADGYARSADVPRRRVDLHVTRKDSVFGSDAAYSFVVAEQGVPPSADSVRFPGSLILLRRGEPTEIMIRNRGSVPLGVHWHGLELESWADGVPGWSGMPGRVIPAVMPGDSLAVRMTPPRAGTFMYHVHSEPGHELAQGLYGPLVVLPPDEEWNADSDRIFLLGSLGTGDDPPAAVNGLLEHGPVAMQAGRAYRLRFMHISPDDTKRVSLLSGNEPVSWRAVARDGADLPTAQVRDIPAELRINVGETYDFVWTPAPGDYTLRILTTFDQGVAAFRRQAPAPHTMDITVRVR